MIAHTYKQRVEESLGSTRQDYLKTKQKKTYKPAKNIRTLLSKFQFQNGIQ